MGTYTKSSINRTARPRSERLRELGGLIVPASAAAASGGGLIPSGSGHTHANLADLNRISITDGYIYITEEVINPDTQEPSIVAEKAMAGYADRAGANADGYTLDWFIPVTVNGSLTLKLNPIYAGFWAEGFITAGGINAGGGGGGGIDLDRVWESLTNNIDKPNVKINSAHIPIATTNAIGGVKVDGTTITIQNGVISAVGGTGGGSVDSITVGSTNYTPDQNGVISIPAYPTALACPNALTFGNKTYDGSAAKTITASDLGALTSHQTIYTLTLQAGSFSAGSYTPNSAAQTINVPTTLDHITDGSSRKLSNYLPLTGGTMTGDLRLKTGGGNYGSKLNFGDGDYLYLYEDTDDHLKIRADKGIEFNTGSSYGLKFGNGVLKWDSTNNAWHLEGNFYADGFITAGGIGGNNTQIVMTTGDQTIDGDKTFIGNTELDGTLYVVNTAEFVSEATFDTGVVIGGASLSYSSSKLNIDTDTKFTYATNKTITISSIVSRLEALGG